MQKLKLTKKIMQAALLLGASRGYVGGKFLDSFSYLRATTSTAVAAAACSTVVAQGLPIPLSFGVIAGILIGYKLYSLVIDLKIGSNVQKHIKPQAQLLLVSTLCFLIGGLLLEWYTSMAVIISMIGLLNCAQSVAECDKETVIPHTGSQGTSKQVSAINESKVFVCTLIGFEILATLIAFISSFVTISVFGMPLIMIIFYLKIVLTLFHCLVAPLVPKEFWYKLGKKLGIKL